MAAAAGDRHRDPAGPAAAGSPPLTGPRPDRDLLPRWLYLRFGHSSQPWETLSIGQRIFWQEQADDITRAVVELSPYRIVPR